METYLRTDGNRRVSRKFGPKEENHPSIGEQCPACYEPFNEGDYTCLVVLGPGNDPEEGEKAREGRVYNAVAMEVHWRCATGEIEE